TKAAEQGLARAQYNLGVFYDKGRGVLQDDKQAVYWYTKAAEQGDAMAQNNLAIYYFTGNAGLLNYKKAYMWFNLARYNGHDTEGTIELITPTMTKEEILEAQSMSQKCLASDYKECG
ncbi:tetratricopeptide repeat protein, partial [Shewanella sp. 10N.286.52.C2]|uniref:tetratricopeptide repeat protein n=1 Tax=Shewanella sp. 10N.286.52.C2 TaxID=1880838 RepID=UPI001054F3D9